MPIIFRWDLFIPFLLMVFVVAGAFAILFYQKRRLFILFTSVIWSLYGIYELGMAIFEPEANIRIDLLLIYPIIALITIVGVVYCFVPKAKRT